MFLNLLFIFILFSLFLETLSFMGFFRPFIKKDPVKQKNKLVPIKDIYHCAQLSEMAYEFDYVFKSKINSLYLECINTNNIKCPDCNFIKFIKNKTNLHCLVTRNDTSKKLIIIFKGTSKIVNWIYNLKLSQMKFKEDFDTNSLIHRGFYQQLLEDDIIGQLEEIIKNIPDNYDVWFCGHSAGGAHSIISSYILANRFPGKRIKTFTFATPRIGNKNFAENFNKIKNLEHWRISYRNDIFTALPIFNYHHFGESIRIYPDKVEYGKYNKFFTFSLFKCFSLLDHHPYFYTHELKKLLDTEKYI